MTPDQWAGLVLIVGSLAWVGVGIIHELKTPEAPNATERSEP